MSYLLQLDFDAFRRPSTQSSDQSMPVSKPPPQPPAPPDLTKLSPDDILKLLPTANLDAVSGRTIREQWEFEFEEVIKADDNLREIVWDTLLAHITVFVRGHPLSQGLNPMVVREIVQEIAFQVQSLVGKAVSGLIDAGSINLPIVEDSVTPKPPFDDQAGSTRSEVQGIIMKLLHSATGRRMQSIIVTIRSSCICFISIVHNEIAGEVTMTLTYLYALDPRPLPLTNEDSRLGIPVKPVIEVVPVPIVKPVVLEPKQFQRPPSPVSTLNKPKRTLVIDPSADRDYDASDGKPYTPPSIQSDVQTLQSPRNLPPSPSPRYMQPLTRSRSSTPTNSSAPTSATTRPMGSRTSSFQDTKPSMSATSTPKSMTGRTRNLTIDDNGIRTNDDGVQTLRQIPTSSPKIVPRYMQPKNFSLNKTDK
jgi:hypothetical protein